ncbi:TPA: hypothetical protein ACXJN2_002054 [Serratia marcescens]
MNEEMKRMESTNIFMSLAEEIYLSSLKEIAKVYGDERVKYINGSKDERKKLLQRIVEVVTGSFDDDMNGLGWEGCIEYVDTEFATRYLFRMYGV